MKYEFKLKSLNYCNVENTISKDNILIFKSVDEVFNYIKDRNLYFSEDRLYYGDYFLDIDFKSDEKSIREYIEDYIKDVEILEKDIKPIRGLRRNTGIIEESAGDLYTYNKTENNIKPIDFKYLLEREKDKYNVIYGLFNSILEANLESINEAIGDNYKAKIQYNKSKANVLCITNYDLGRCCYIKYENINSHKSFGYIKEEIEEYLQRIIVGFVMEYDK